MWVALALVHVTAIRLHADHDTPVKELALIHSYLQGATTKEQLLHAVKEHEKTMTVDEAMSKLSKKLPLHVTTLLESKHRQPEEAPPSFDQDALDRALQTLNGMIETAQSEYDLKDMECRAFEERNREEYRQTESDLARLGSALAGDGAKITESVAAISEAGGVIEKQDEFRRNAENACMQTKLENEASLRIIKNDLVIAKFIVDMTACEQALLQGAKGAKTVEVEQCPMADGGVMLSFKDQFLQDKSNKLGSGVAKEALRVALAKSHPAFTETQISLIESEQEPTPESAPPTESAPPSLSDIMNPPQMKGKVVPPMKGPDPQKAATKCVLGKPDCGRLNDNMALMWGAIKDQVDELTSLMNDNAIACKAEQDMYNAEIATWQMVQNDKGVVLAEATGSKNTNTEEQAESEAEKAMLTKEYDSVMGDCDAILYEILYTDICGTKTVRGEIAKFSTTWGPTDLLDCEVTDWVPTECTIGCIDTGLCEGLPKGKMPPMECYGGTQFMERHVVQPRAYWTEGGQNLTIGHDCPALQLEKPCNAFPCPTDCEMGEWSEFGKCSKDCGGGVKARTRPITVRAANGGESCPSDTDTQQCNTHSCDVDCVLREWTPWSPCSRACMGGTQERFRHINEPHKGLGTCEAEKSEERFEFRSCNKFECPANATCGGSMDVVLVVDVSGSLKFAGFDTMKRYVRDFVNLHNFSDDRVNMGLVEYSTEAQIVSPMTADKDTFLGAVDNMHFLRGVTDMAAGMALAKTVLLEGRKESPSTVIVFTDNKPSFQFSTSNSAKQLRDNGSRLVIVPIYKYGNQEYMEKISSTPARDNVLKVAGGLDALATTHYAEAESLMIGTCPELEAPQAAAEAPPATSLQAVFGVKKKLHFRGINGY